MTTRIQPPFLVLPLAQANQASTAAEATRRAAELAEMQARVAAAHVATAASARELMAARAAAAAAEEKVRCVVATASHLGPWWSASSLTPPLPQRAQAAAAAGKAAELQRLNAALIVKVLRAADALSSVLSPLSLPPHLLVFF